MVVADFCCIWLSKMYGHGWKRSHSKGNSSALPLMATFEYHENVVLWQMLFSLWKVSAREWDGLRWCYRWCWLVLHQRERGTWRSTGSSPGLSDSDVGKWFSDLKGHLISSEKHLGQNTSCIFFLLLITADRMILFREVASPWLLRVYSFSGYPVAHGFVTMQNHSSFSLERKNPWFNGCLRRDGEYLLRVQFSAAAFETLQEKLQEVKMKGSVSSIENLGFFSPAFQNMLKGETHYL